MKDSFSSAKEHPALEKQTLWVKPGLPAVRLLHAQRLKYRARADHGDVFKLTLQLNPHRGPSTDAQQSWGRTVHLDSLMTKVMDDDDDAHVACNRQPKARLRRRGMKRTAVSCTQPKPEFVMMTTWLRPQERTAYKSFSWKWVTMRVLGTDEQ